MRRSLALAVSLYALAACDRSAEQGATAPAPSNVAAPARVGKACPDDMALATFEGGEICIDRYEGSLQGWRYSRPLDGIDAGTARSPKAVSARGVKPQVNISEEQAEAACEASSKRLCSAAEWTGACRGAAKTLYPYGNQRDDGACNVGRPRPNPLTLGVTDGRLDDPRLAEADHGIEPTGSFPKCVTPSGVFDMNGNVHEWVSDSSNPSDPRFGTFLGGYFADGSENGEGCTYKTTAHFKSYHDYSTGFRCCRDAERRGARRREPERQP